MSANDWQLEISNLLEIFARASMVSLRNINRCFAASGRPFDKEFRQHFLDMSTTRLGMCYDSILFEQRSDENALQIAGSNSNSSIHHGEVASNSNISIGNVAAVNASASSSLLAVKVESNIDASIEIDDSDDEADERHLQVQATKNTIEERAKSNSAPIFNDNANCHDDESINIDSGDENDTVVIVKQEPKPEIADEIEDLPLVEFDPNQENDGSNVESDSIGAESLNKEKQSSTSSKGQTEAKRKYDRVFRCNKCAYTSKRNSNLKRHQLTHDANAAKPFECQKCSYATRDKSNLNAHQRSHGRFKLLGVQWAQKDGLFNCPHCDQQFSKCQNLTLHLSKSHKNGRRLFNCGRCMRPFSRKTEREWHENRCARRRYECYLCKMYATKLMTNMQVHMRTHTGAKPFRCAICNKRFRIKSHLKRHLDAVHSRT